MSDARVSRLEREVERCC